MKLINAILFLLVSGMIAFGQGSRLQYTEAPEKTARRVVDNKVYNLLLQSNLWKFATCKYVRPQTYIGGWVVSGKVGDTNDTFVLKNPPTEALARFTSLKAEYVQVKADYQQLLGEYESLTNTSEQISLQVKRYKVNPSLKPGSRDDAKWQRELGDAINQQQDLENQTVNMGDQLKTLSTRLDHLKAQGFELEGEFIFGCYVLRVQQTVEKLPVYDHGRIMN